VAAAKYFPTQLETFLQCRFKYQCSRDKEIRDKHRKPGPPLFMGSAVHDALEAFFDITRVPVAERTYEKLSNLLRRAWAGVDLSEWKRTRHQAERKVVFGDDTELERSWGTKALNILYRYFLITDKTVIPFTAEQFHETKLAEGIVLAGKIDRIDKLDDGSLKVIDYKTGKLPWKRDDESIAEEDLQLSTYAIVVGRKYRVPVTRCSLVFLAHDEELGFTPTNDLLAAKAARIEEVCRAIEAEEEFAPTENVFCPWCEYREICPVGMKIAGAGEGVVKEPDVPF